MEKKYTIAYLKNYSFCIHIFLRQLCVFFAPIDSSYYFVLKIIRGIILCKKITQFLKKIIKSYKPFKKDGGDFEVSKNMILRKIFCL